MERTYVFNQDGGAGSSNGLLASILPSLQNRGIDTGYLMGLMGGNGNGGFFGNNGGFQDIIALIVIAAIFGNGNFGFGGNNNQGANEGREMIMQTLNRNGVDIASLAQSLNTSSPGEFQNSWDHEKGHLCRHISKAFGIDPYGEEAQYLSGEVGQKMFPIAKRFLCEHCRKGLKRP